jgi:hypothetical protein
MENSFVAHVLRIAQEIRVLNSAYEIVYFTVRSQNPVAQNSKFLRHGQARAKLRLWGVQRWIDCERIAA